MADSCKFGTPDFVDEGVGNFRLRPESPAIDSGINAEVLAGITDTAGSPRIGNHRVDIGAYEFYFDGGIRARLQGPLSALTGLMSTNAPVALQSPYASDPRIAPAIATNTVDWVLLELYRQTNQPPVFARSVLLRDDGQLTTEDGHAVVPIDVTPMTNYWVAVKHRGHLASVTASAIPFTNNVVEVDFTVGSAAYLGGTNTAVQVGTHWAARAGDVDGDGVITALDQIMADSQSGASGNQRGDLNRDGIVDALDDALIAGNLGSSSDGFGTALSPALVISPDRRTLVSGESLPLMSDGSSATRWAYVRNQTGSTLSTTNGPSATYTAGPTHGQVDVLQAWDPVDGRVGRTYLNVISPAEVNALGKAVILAGGRSLDDPVWPATEYLSAKAHNALRYRGYSQANLLHLNFLPGRDLDGDGLDNDIDGPATLATAQHAFTSFISDASQVFIYLVDHGATVQSNGLFRLNQNEFLSAQDLDNWLDTFQGTSGMDVVVVLDFCYAGAFAQQLEYDGMASRIILSATQPGQPTYFIAGGQVSYSEYFWNGVYQGLTLGRAHGLAAGVMNPYQQGWLDDDANGVGNGSDGALAAVRTVGASFVAGKSYPVIERALDGQALAGTTEATLWVDLVNSAYPVDRLWCTITPPNYNVNPNTGVPVVDIPVRDLTRNPVSGRWEFDYDGFTQEGPYIVNFFARDIWSSVSPPKTVTIDQRGFDERVILVAGGPASGVHWAATRDIARKIRATLASRLVSTNDLQFLSAEAFDDFGHPGTNQVDRLATRAQLQQAFQNPIVQAGVDGSNKLTVWFVGAATNGQFRLNASETVSAADLNGWLGYYQRNGAKAQVILDFDGAGGWLGSLQAPGNRERILLAGSEANRAALLRDDLGLSAVVCSGLNQGQTLGAAADRARKVVRRASGNLRQKVLIEDSGNGVANEKDLDGRVAAQRYVGSAFVTGEDRPVIGSVLPEQVVTNGQSVLVWAAEVSDATGVSNVWVNVTAPGNWADALTTRLDLVYHETSGRWEAESLPFDQAGVHIVGFQAMDIHSNLSEVVQSRILVEEAEQTTRRLPHLPDPFEPDGLCEEAPIFDLPLIQTRSLHASNDCDAVLFFAQSDLVYDIETVHLTNTVDTVIEIHRVMTNGTTVLVDRIDEFGTDEGELGGLDYPDEGLYCVRVCHADGTPFAPGSYVLIIHVPVGFTGINITAWNRQTQQGMAGAVARLYDTGGNVLTNTTVGVNGQVKFLWPRGSYRVEVVPPQGYLPDFDPKNAYNVPENAESDYGNARSFGVNDFGTVSWGSAGGSSSTYLGFAFLPGVAVTGSVVDEVTHEVLGNAGFAALQSTTGQGFNRYPWASYGALWRSTPGGNFPPTLYLPPSSGFSMLVGGVPGYVNQTVNFTTPASAPLDLGRIELPPVDSDNDGLPDAWEQANLGGLSFDGASNPDGDAFSTAQEFQAGTHPNQGGSELKLVDPTITGDTLTLTWPAVATRQYNIRSAATLNGEWMTEDLATNPPVISGGMATWTTPAPADRRYYQIETVFLP